MDSAQFAVSLSEAMDHGQTGSTEGSPSESQSEKKRDGQKDVEEEGEYGVYVKKVFHSLSNFVLRCVGVVEEDGAIVGYMVQAKPKNNRGDEERW